MSTQIEDRLTAALHARAELVQPEDLGHHIPPQPAPTPLWRRPAVVALVAAAAVVAVAVPVVLRSDHSGHQHPQPVDHAPTPIPKIKHRLAGDVDGDGKPDQIRVSGHTLTVTLAADPSHRLTKSDDKDLAGLAGLGDVGTPGLGILTVEDSAGKVGVNWGIVALRHGKLRTMAQVGSDSASGSLASYPGIVFSWVSSGGVPMSGALDPMQDGQRRRAVKVTRFLPRHGDLASSYVGRWCWDVVTQKVPAPCPQGVTDAFDPGTHGSLPNLARTRGGDYGDSWASGSTDLRIAKARPHVKSLFKQLYNVVGTIDGQQVSGPAGYADPSLWQSFIDLGHGVRGLATNDVSKSTWNLLAVTSNGLVPLAADDPSNGANGANYLHPGTMAAPVGGKLHRSDTWLGPDDQVFTRVENGDGAGHYRVYDWQVSDSSSTTLTPVDLGEVCMDDFQATYGTCS
jgi:hypothetical protein